MSKPSIGIIIPTYNRAEVISKAIGSVLAQKSDNWNLIVVDDGSTDGTQKILEEFSTSLKISYLYQEHSGVSAARNLGLKSINTDFVIFLDSDDEICPDLIKDLLKMDLKKYDMVFWKVKKRSGNLTTFLEPRKLEEIYNGLKASFLSGSVCYNAQLIKDVGGFDENLEFGENYEMGLRLTQTKKLHTKYLPKVNLIYNFNENYRSNSEPEIKLKSLKHLLDKHKTLYLRDKFSYSRILYQIGFLYEKLGKYKEAICYFKKASRVSPFYLKPLVKRIILKLNLR